MLPGDFAVRVPPPTPWWGERGAVALSQGGTIVQLRVLGRLDNIFGAEPWSFAAHPGSEFVWIEGPDDFRAVFESSRGGAVQPLRTMTAAGAETLRLAKAQHSLTQRP